MNTTDLPDLQMTFSAATHNGTITVESPSGEHRTFRIRTQPEKANFAPGERILSLLSGTDEYKGLGFLKTTRKGRPYVVLFKKNRTPYLKKLIKVVLFPEHYEALGCRFLYAGTCRACNRPLTNPASIDSGIGPICGANESL